MNRKTSNVWQYCIPLDKTHAKCGLCKQRLSYKSSITNIKRHLARKHPEICQYQHQQYQVAETIEIKPHASNSEVITDRLQDHDENSDTENNSSDDFKVIREVTPTAGSFHIVPKYDNNEKESETQFIEMLSPKPRKEIKKQRTSDIWQHCTVIDNVFAKCNLCEAVLSYRTSITNIKKHLARKHMFPYNGQMVTPKKTITIYENEDEEELTEPNKIAASLEHETPSFLHNYSRKKEPPSMTLKNKVDTKLLDLFIKDYQSYKIVEEVGFRSFVKSLNSSYVIPTRQQILRSLSATYGKCLMDMKDLAQNIKECCLTTECWTSAINECYITVTIHFIDEEFTMKSILLECFAVHATTHIAGEFQRITEEWGVDKKILLAVSDNDINVEAAMAELKWNHFGCFAHTLNSLVQEALLDMDSILEKVRCIIFHFKSNPETISKLELHQRNADSTIKPKKLLQECPNKWNSCLRMLERFLDLEDAVKNTSLLYQDTDLPELSSEDWKIIVELSTILKPFETVANFISSEKYTSASLVIVLTKEIDDALDALLETDFSLTIKATISKLKESLAERLGNVETSETLALCTYLDPRFKNLGFFNTDAAEATKDHLVGMLSNKIPDQPNNDSNSLKIESDDSNFFIWQSFKKRVSECRQPGTSKSKALVEIERFLEDELMDQQKNPLEWWREYKGIYPSMSVVAQEVMCALGTSVPSDRIFTSAGQTLNLRRNCLSSDEVKILTFLNNNLD